MIWKPKEKELTQEEAIDLAKEELAPYWFGIPPQIAGIKTNSGYVVLPLDPEFSKKSWLFFFIDPTDFSGQTAAVFAREWYRRYGSHNLSILMVLLPIYHFWQLRENIHSYKEMLQIPFSIVADLEQRISNAFGVQDPPRILLLDKGHRHFEYSGPEWLKNTELNIQEFLRSKDPGLSCFQIFKPSRPVLYDVRRIEFGYAPKLGKEVSFDTPGFVQSPKGYRTGSFHNLRPLKLENEQFFISGEWIQDAEKIATSDPHASLVFATSEATVGVVAQSLSKTMEVPIIQVEVDGTPAYDGIAGEGLTLEDTGLSVIKVRHTQLYQILRDLPSQAREVALKFPNASTAPVAIYGLRFGAIDT